MKDIDRPGDVGMKPTPPQRLSYRDAAFTNFERESFPMNVGSVGVYEGEIPFAQFLAHVESRIQLVPAYWQRLIEVPGRIEHAAWTNDPEFDVRRHVSTVMLLPPGNEAQLERAAGAHRMRVEALPHPKPHRARPLSSRSDAVR